MRARHLGTESNTTGCPALYATDRRTFIVQGWKVGDPQRLAGLTDVRDGEFFVEIPKGLLRYDDGDRGDVAGLDRPGRPAMFTTCRDTYLVRGWEVTDPEAIADLVDVRENEAFVEIPKPVLRNPQNGVGDQVKEGA
jgi:hypothetical protein